MYDGHLFHVSNVLEFARKTNTTFGGDREKHTEHTQKREGSFSFPKFYVRYVSHPVKRGTNSPTLKKLINVLPRRFFSGGTTVEFMYF